MSGKELIVPRIKRLATIGTRIGQEGPQQKGVCIICGITTFADMALWCEHGCKERAHKACLIPYIVRRMNRKVGDTVYLRYPQDVREAMIEACGTCLLCGFLTREKRPKHITKELVVEIVKEWAARVSYLEDFTPWGGAKYMWLWVFFATFVMNVAEKEIIISCIPKDVSEDISWAFNVPKYRVREYLEAWPSNILAVNMFVDMWLIFDRLP